MIEKNRVKDNSGNNHLYYYKKTFRKYPELNKVVPKEDVIIHNPAGTRCYN